MTNSEKMLKAIENKNIEDADYYFNQALLHDDEALLLSLAEYLESIGFFPQAKAIYLKLKKHYPEVAINLAQIVAEEGDIETAFLYLDEISKESEYYLPALLVMADLYDMEGLTDVAREKLVEATQLSHDPLVVFGLAEIELSLEHYKEAITEYAKLDHQELFELTGVSTYQRIGKAYASLGKFEAAIEFLEKSLELDYSEETLFELATILYQQQEYQKANIYFKQLENLSGDFSGYEYVYALSLHKEDQIEEALKVAQQGLAKNEFDSQLLLLASQLSYETHDSKAAETYLLSAQQLVEDKEEVFLRLTTLYLEEERYEEIIALAKESIDNVLTRWNIAKAYQALENEEESLKAYEELSKDLKDNPEFLKDYFYVLREYGDTKKMRAIGENYLKLVPDDLEIVHLLEEWD
ncbi:tetratricopeptide repeat protein [Streptococcus pacificus]|uniref:Tetratricopeptide repeat protein n=1 Tax=Streptococcus pacificus TaxID=2740577 RepID=A0ABS0ZJ03_9STRE|nr:CDC27 family protein [Streptococcus pacificus]MBJ8325967.1 tetratricopeptide repeat protein [Streptococcus pacificus]